MAEVQAPQQHISTRPAKQKVSLDGFLACGGKINGKEEPAGPQDIVLNACEDVAIDALLTAAKTDQLPTTTKAKTAGDSSKRSKPRTSCRPKKLSLEKQQQHGENEPSSKRLTVQSAHVRSLSPSCRPSSEARRASERPRNRLSRAQSFDKTTIPTKPRGGGSGDNKGGGSKRKSAVSRSKSFDGSDNSGAAVPLKRIPRNSPRRNHSGGGAIIEADPAGGGGRRSMGEKSLSLRKMGEHATGGASPQRKSLGGRSSSLKKLGEKQSSERKLGEKQPSIKKLGEKQSSIRKLGEKQSSNRKLGEKQSSNRKLGEKQSSNRKLGEKQPSNRKLEKQSSKRKLGKKQPSKRKLGEKQSSNRKPEQQGGGGGKSAARRSTSPSIRTKRRSRSGKRESVKSGGQGSSKPSMGRPLLRQVTGEPMGNNTRPLQRQVTGDISQEQNLQRQHTGDSTQSAPCTLHVRHFPQQDALGGKGAFEAAFGEPDDDDDDEIVEEEMFPNDDDQDGSNNQEEIVPPVNGIMQFDPNASTNVVIVRQDSRLEDFPSCPVELDLSSHRDHHQSAGGNDDAAMGEKERTMDHTRSITPDPEHHSHDQHHDDNTNKTSRWGKTSFKLFHTTTSSSNKANKSSATSSFTFPTLSGMSSKSSGGGENGAHDEQTTSMSTTMYKMAKDAFFTGGHQQLGDDSNDDCFSS